MCNLPSLLQHTWDKTHYSINIIAHAIRCFNLRLEILIQYSICHSTAIAEGNKLTYTLSHLEKHVPLFQGPMSRSRESILVASRFFYSDDQFNLQACPVLKPEVIPPQRDASRYRYRTTTAHPRNARNAAELKMLSQHSAFACYMRYRSFFGDC